MQPQPADGPDIEDTPDPELDTTAVAAVEETAGPATTAAAPDSTGSAERAGTAATGTVCDAGEVVLEDFVSDSDDGCRPEFCELGRTRQGECYGDHVALIAGPTTTLAPQPAGEPCQQPAAGESLRFSSDSYDPDDPPLLHLGRGEWRMDICVRHNDRTGRPERLKVSMSTPVVSGVPMDVWFLLDVISAANGDWSSDEFKINYPDPVPPLRLGVDADGGGDWVATFTHTAPEVRTRRVDDPAVTGGRVAVTAEPTGGRYLTVRGVQEYVVFIGPHGDLTYGISWTAENAVSVALDTRRPGWGPAAAAPALQSGTWTLPTPTEPGALIHTVYAHGEAGPVRVAVPVRFMIPAE